jgi:hypothetical protein
LKYFQSEILFNLDNKTLLIIITPLLQFPFFSKAFPRKM